MYIISFKFYFLFFNDLKLHRIVKKYLLLVLFDKLIIALFVRRVCLLLQALARKRAYSTHNDSNEQMSNDNRPRAFYII